VRQIVGAGLGVGHDLKRRPAALAELERCAGRHFGAGIGRDPVHRHERLTEQIDRPIARSFSHQREMMTRDDVRVRRIHHLAIEPATEHDAIDVRFDALLGSGQRSAQMSDDEHDRSRPVEAGMPVRASAASGDINPSACSSPTCRRAVNR
jgi:hypothetical protein